MKFFLSTLGLAFVLTVSGCRTGPSLLPEGKTDIVFALGPRENFVSPMKGALKPACPALEFQGISYALTGAHQKTLKELSDPWKETKPRYLIAGYAAPELPEDYARSLSERRALAVRQSLIESGVEAASLQTVGFGQDSAPSGPTTGVVVIYKQ